VAAKGKEEPAVKRRMELRRSNNSLNPTPRLHAFQHWLLRSARMPFVGAG
jgi:hypothetical protein